MGKHSRKDDEKLEEVIKVILDDNGNEIFDNDDKENQDEQPFEEDPEFDKDYDLDLAYIPSPPSAPKLKPRFAKPVSLPSLKLEKETREENDAVFLFENSFKDMDDETDE